jgi:uncharacterized glyoxalase superfamily protein PhnB
MTEERTRETGGVTPYLTIKDGRASEASAFYAKAFGAKELFRQPADDGRRLLHCRLELNGGLLMLSDDFQGSPAPAGFTLHLQTEDAQALWDRAIAAGAVETMPLAKQFWGDIYGKVRDPFGVDWSIASTPKSY